MDQQAGFGSGEAGEWTVTFDVRCLIHVDRFRTAQVLQKRGTVIVLADTPAATWGIADALKVDENKRSLNSDDLGHVQRFRVDEMGQDFPLVSLLEYGVGVHHGGMSEDTRSLVEWLTENDRLGVLVATTTIAQGVNFPVSGVVFASHQYRLRKFPYRIDMPPQDFWYIAGRPVVWTKVISVLWLSRLRTMPSSRCSRSSSMNRLLN